jgi:hypothetical protein
MEEREELTISLMPEWSMVKTAKPVVLVGLHEKFQSTWVARIH